MGDEHSTKLRPKAVAALLGKSVSGVYALAKTDPTFPAFVKLSARHSYIERAAIERYIRRKAADAAVARVTS